MNFRSDAYENLKAMRIIKISPISNIFYEYKRAITSIRAKYHITLYTAE
jgi:hypothetical protein